MKKQRDEAERLEEVMQAMRQLKRGETRVKTEFNPGMATWLRQLGFRVNRSNEIATIDRAIVEVCLIDDDLILVLTLPDGGAISVAIDETRIKRIDEPKPSLLKLVPRDEGEER